MKEVFKKADVSEEINVDGEDLTNLRFPTMLLFSTKKNKKKTTKTNGKTIKQS